MRIPQNIHYPSSDYEKKYSGVKVMIKFVRRRNIDILGLANDKEGFWIWQR